LIALNMMSKYLSVQWLIAYPASGGQDRDCPVHHCLGNI